MSRELPGTVAITFSSVVRPSPGILASKRSDSSLRPYGSSAALSQFAALVEPGGRSARCRERSIATPMAAFWSKEGGSVGLGNAVGLVTVKAAMSRGIATSSQVPRYIRAEIGRSTDPGRGRRVALCRVADIAGL